MGGALVDLASWDDGAAVMLDRLVRNLPREQDRRAFVGWTPGDLLLEARAADGASDRTLDGKADRAAGGTINAAVEPGPAAMVEAVEPAAEPSSVARFSWKAYKARHP